MKKKSLGDRLDGWLDGWNFDEVIDGGHGCVLMLIVGFAIIMALTFLTKALVDFIGEVF